MKRAKNILSNKYTCPILLIFLATFFVWNKILNQTFLGEGYFYFEPWRSFISASDGYRVLNSYDNFARFMFTYLAPILRDNLFLYQLFALLTCATLNITVFICLYKITKNRVLSLFSAILFASNYIGTFEMIAEGNYDRFLQRIPNLIPAVIAFYFLYKYIKSGNRKDIIYSYILYAIATFMAHFTTMMLPLFISFPIVELLVNERSSKKITRTLIALVGFLVLTFAFVFPDPYQPHKSFLAFLLNEGNLPFELAYQFPAILMPHFSIQHISNILSLSPQVNSYLPMVKILLLPITAVYLYGATKVYKKDKNLFVLYISFALGMIGGLVLYFYSDDKLRPYVELAQGRQYYIFEIYASIIISIFLFSIIVSPKKYLRVLMLFSLIFILYNAFYVWHDIDALNYRTEADRRYIAYIKSLTPLFTKDTVLFTRSSMHWPNDMLLRFYLPQGAIQITNLADLKHFNPDPKNVFVIEYDFGINPLEQPNPNKGKLIDLTEKFRRGEADLSSW